MTCQKCGRKHEPRQCPAYGAVCHKCRKNNHFSKVCRTLNTKSGNDRAKVVHNIESEVDSLYIGSVDRDGEEAACHKKDNKWYETATIRGVPITFKLDTGADTSVLPMSIFKQLPGPIQLRPTETVLVAFSGARLPSDGIASLQCKTDRRAAIVEFHVTSLSEKAILGEEACTELGLVKRVHTIASTQPTKPPSTKRELIEEYAVVFTGLGEFPGVHHIHVDPSVPPVIHGCRNIPLSIMDTLKDTLQDLEKRNVTKPVKSQQNG